MHAKFDMQHILLGIVIARYFRPVAEAGTQQRRKFLEQFLYLGRESGDGGGGLGAPGANKRTGTCLGEGAAPARGRVHVGGGGGVERLGWVVGLCVGVT